MAGPGKQRKLGPGPESGVCGLRVRPGSCVGVAGSLCQPAHRPLGATQSTLPGAGCARPPTCRGPPARGSPGRLGPGQQGRAGALGGRPGRGRVRVEAAGRAEGGEGVAEERSEGGTEGGRTGGVTSQLL